MPKGPETCGRGSESFRKSGLAACLVPCERRGSHRRLAYPALSARGPGPAQPSGVSSGDGNLDSGAAAEQERAFDPRDVEPGHCRFLDLGARPRTPAGGQ